MIALLFYVGLKLYFLNNYIIFFFNLASAVVRHLYFFAQRVNKYQIAILYCSLTNGVRNN